ncbi:hypothetical protein [Mesorhizobium sp.]|jgi:hypothetical protein
MQTYLTSDTGKVYTSLPTPAVVCNDWPTGEKPELKKAGDFPPFSVCLIQ